MAHTYILFVMFVVATHLNANNISIPVACTPPNDNFLFCNTSLSISERINNIISLLTLNEKAHMLTARQSPSIPRLGIPAYNWGTNCIHSVLSQCGTRCPTAFPEPNGLGASFNKTLIYNISVVIGLELRALWLQNVSYSGKGPVGLDCWGPTINIGRDPRWGRMYEVISEDPLWNGLYATLFTLGLQNGSVETGYHDPNYYMVAATLKHLAAYSLGGYQSFTFNAIVSDYMFADTYFPAFIAAVQNGNAKGIMCSYNSINGVPACLDDDLLQKHLRDEWQFDGYITSDSSAIEQAYKGHHYTDTLAMATELALKAGCDIDSGWQYEKYIPPLVNEGSIPEDLVNKALFNSFKIRFELGLFDQPVQDQIYFNIPPQVVNSKTHKELNLLSSHQVMTLLKNENNTLPFNTNNTSLIYGVIGPHYNASVVFTAQYSGQVCMDSTHSCIPSILTGIQMYVDPPRILYSEGCNDVLCNSTIGFTNATNIANQSDIIILMMGLNGKVETEGIDRINISLPGYQQLLASKICKLGKPTVLVLVNGGIVAIDELKYECPAILEIWYPGFYGAQAMADTLFGINNPGGKMPVTMYWSNFTKMTDWHGMDLTSQYGRTYKYWYGPQPLYPFAWGLSYTDFQFELYNDFNKTCDQINRFCIQISNIGNVSGYETIFVFVEMPQNESISHCEPASKMIKRLTQFHKMYLNSGESYVFRWNYNKTKDLMMYTSNGLGKVFVGNYTILFTNGVHQNLRIDVKVPGVPDMNEGCESKHTFWSATLIVIICGVAVLVIVILGSLWYCKHRNVKDNQSGMKAMLNDADMMNVNEN